MSITIPGIPEREAEIIGLILQSPPSINEIGDRVPASAFTNGVTKAVWEGMQTLSKAGTRVSIPALRETVRADLDRAGIPSLPAFLATCMHRATGDLGLSDLADILVDRALKADVSATLSEIQKLVAADQETGEELALKASKMLSDIVAGQKPKSIMTLHEAAQVFTAEVSESFRSGEPVGHDWGLRELDRLMGTIRPGDFGLLGGPTAHAKTALATQIAMHVAKRLPVLMIQAEMDQAAIAARIIMGMTGVSSEIVESGRMQAGEVEAMIGAATKLNGVPFEIAYTDDMRISKIRTMIQGFLHRWGKCGLVIVDTINHVDPESKRKDSTEASEITASAQKLGKMTTAMQVPVMALAQVKKDYFHRPGWAFYEEDMFGGGFQQAADWILLMHQPAKKIEKLIEKAGHDDPKLQAQFDKWSGIAQVRCAKRRRGPNRAGVLRWIGERTMFADPDDEVEDTFL